MEIYLLVVIMVVLKTIIFIYRNKTKKNDN